MFMNIKYILQLTLPSAVSSGGCFNWRLNSDESTTVKKKTTKKKPRRAMMRWRERKINGKEVRRERGQLRWASERIFTPPPSNYRVHTAASITRSSARLLFTAARQRPRRRQLVKEEIHHRTQVNPPEDPSPPSPPPRLLISSAEQTPPGRVNTQDDSCLAALPWAIIRCRITATAGLQF